MGIKPKRPANYKALVCLPLSKVKWMSFFPANSILFLSRIILDLKKKKVDDSRETGS